MSGLWIFFAIGVFVFTLLNIIEIFNKHQKWGTIHALLALSFTALFLVSEIHMVNYWVLVEDWSAILDVVPSLTIMLSVITAVSIVVNIGCVLWRRIRSGKDNECA